MKLINHRQGYNYEYKDGEQCFIRGTITMTRKESEAVTCMLTNEYQKALKSCDTYTRDALGGKITSIRDKDATLLCLGVCATKLIVDRYNLKNYKDVNYCLKIKNI